MEYSWNQYNFLITDFLNVSCKTLEEVYHEFENFENQETIRLATVICSQTGDNGPREEAAVLIKSVVISKIMYHIPNAIEFHLFVEHNEDEIYFESKLKEYTNNLTNASITLKFHSAQDMMSKYYHPNMIHEERLRCMYVRIFLPNALDTTDAVIYTDTDAIITGNLKQLWDLFYNMTSEQIFGVVPDFEPQNPKTSHLLTDVPFPPPKGINSGIQLMNLTRMRAYEWKDKMMRLYNDYAIRQNIKMRSDQKLTNILLYFDSGIFLQLPCQFNFWFAHCSEGFYCNGVVLDPVGIQVIHGAASGFSHLKPFGDIFSQYQNFDLVNNTDKSWIKNGLMFKIRNTYTETSNKKIEGQRIHKFCNGVIDKYLYKDQFFQ